MDQHICLRPVRAKDREHPGEYAAVSGIGPAVAHRNNGYPVGRRPLDQRIGDAGGKRAECRRPGRAFALQALVAFDTPVGEVTGLAFLSDDLDAVDAAVPLIHHRQIVSIAVGEWNAVRGVWAGPIDQGWNELLILRLRRGVKAYQSERRYRDTEQ